MLIDWSLRKYQSVGSDPRMILPPEANYQLGRMIVGLGAAALLNLDIKKHSLIPDGPKIFAANHPTTTDPGLLTLLSKEPMAILIAETLYKVPVLGSYLHSAGHIVVKPGQGIQALDSAVNVLESGKNIGIFSEGSLSPEEGGFMSPKTGTARLALSTGTPILPVGIYLDQSQVRFLHTKVEGKTEVSRWCLSGPYAMTVGAPMVLTGDVNDWPYVRYLSDTIMGRITRLALQSEKRVKPFLASTDNVGWLPNMWAQSFTD